MSKAFPYHSKTTLLGLTAIATFSYLLYKTHQTSRKLATLTLELLALQNREIQSLRGSSTRKSWLETQSVGLQAWASNLLKAQRANAVSLPARPSDAKGQELYGAAERGNLPELVAFLAAGYNPNEEEELHPKFGTSPLMEGAFHGRVEIVKALLEYNARVNTRSGYGWTALHYAGQANQPEVVKLLLAAGADGEIRNNKGKTCKERAVAQGKVEVVEAVYK